MKPAYVFVLALGSAICTAPVSLAKAGGAPGGAHPPASAPSAPSNPGPSSRPAMPPPAQSHGANEMAPSAPRAAAPAAEKLAGAMHDINQTAFAQRREVLENVDMRLKSSRDALKQIQAEAKDSRADARADFKTSLADVKARQKDLDAALKASRKADESNWEARRADLAKAAQNHAEAMARLEAARLAPKS